MKKIFIFTFVLLISALTVGPNVLALGLVTEPIIIANALRGNEYQEILMIVNTDNAQANIGFSTEGKIAGWAKFYLPNDLKNPIENLEMEAKQNQNIVAIFLVPTDAPNGKYDGFVSVIKKPAAMSQQDGSSSSVAQKIDREVSITVGGEEKISLQVSVIPKKYDIKKNSPLDIRFIFDNLGNVSLRPQIDLKIKNLDGKVVYNAIYPYPENEPVVRPGAQYEIPAIAVPTNGLVNGKYLVEIDFLHNNQVIFEKDFRFSVITGGIVAGLKTISSRIFWPIGIGITIIAMAVFTLLRVKRIIKNKKIKNEAIN